ncbi:MAG: hypothetical protein ABSC19_04210 [Syntrophorhabdales bacterium]|jgi:hypothetical protein
MKDEKGVNREGRGRFRAERRTARREPAGKEVEFTPFEVEMLNGMIISSKGGLSRPQPAGSAYPVRPGRGSEVE